MRDLVKRTWTQRLNANQQPVANLLNWVASFFRSPRIGNRAYVSGLFEVLSRRHTDNRCRLPMVDGNFNLVARCNIVSRYNIWIDIFRNTVNLQGRYCHPAYCNPAVLPLSCSGPQLQSRDCNWLSANFRFLLSYFFVPISFSKDLSPSPAAWRQYKIIGLSAIFSSIKRFL
jgi:hypothetical protein